MSFVEKAVSRLKQREGAGAKKKHDPVARPMDASPSEQGSNEGTITGLSVIVDHDALVRAGYIASEKFERRLAEEFRHIKRPLLEDVS